MACVQHPKNNLYMFYQVTYAETSGRIHQAFVICRNRGMVRLAFVWEKRTFEEVGMVRLTLGNLHSIVREAS